MTLYIRETIGWLLYLLYRWGLWRSPGYWWSVLRSRQYGYGQLNYNTGEFQFPVRELERDGTYDQAL